MTGDGGVSVTESPEFSAVFKHRKGLVNRDWSRYVVGGGGDALPLIDGFPRTRYMWREIMLPLARRYPAVAPDLRGCGDSDMAAYPDQTRALAYLDEPLPGFNLGHCVIPTSPAS